MAKRRKTYRRHFWNRPRRRGSHKMTLPLAPIAGFAVAVMPSVECAMRGEDIVHIANPLIRGLTGFDIFSHDWGYQRLMEGAFPIIVGLLVHKFIGGRPIGVNNMLAKANVPFIRI